MLAKDWTKAKTNCLLKKKCRCNNIQKVWRSFNRVVMAEWLVRWTPNHNIVGSSPAKASRLIKNHPAWATGGDNGASVHSAVNEYLAIDRDRNCT